MPNVDALLTLKFSHDAHLRNGLRYDRRHSNLQQDIVPFWHLCTIQSRAQYLAQGPSDADTNVTTTLEPSNRPLDDVNYTLQVRCTRAWSNYELKTGRAPIRHVTRLPRVNKRLAR